MRKFLIFSWFITTLTTAVGQSFTEVSIENGLISGYGEGAFGGGLSFCDFNGDGWDDLTFASQAGDSLYFFVNQQGTMVPVPPLVDNTDESKQVIWVDYDNDGDQDLFVTCYGAPNRMYRNEGNLELVDVTQEIGLGLSNAYTFGAAFGDYDRDGNLDLYVVNRELTLTTNFLYRNMGNGTFVDVSTAAGVNNGYKPSFCAAFLDINRNGYPDLYIAQDRYNFANDLYKNRENGTFEDISQSSESDISIDAMNVGPADYDHDGDLDIYVTNTAAGNKFLWNKGDESFFEAANLCGVALHQVSWGANFVDLDNDTWEDLYVSTYDSLAPNALFRNLGIGVFSPAITIGDDLGHSFANAVGDLNQDGYPDLAVSNAEGSPFRLWENEGGMNNWIRIKLQGLESNRDGYGSWIEVYIDDTELLRFTHCGTAYLAQNSNVHHIGLGQATLIDSIKIQWPSGVVDKLEEVEPNQTLMILENSTILVDQVETALHPGAITFKFASFFDQGVSIGIHADQNRDVRFELYNSAGQPVGQWLEQLYAGENNLRLPMQKMPAGTYLLVARSRESRATIQMVKVKFP